MSRSRSKPAAEPDTWENRARKLLEARQDGWRAGMIEGMSAAVRLLVAADMLEPAKAVASNLERRFGVAMPVDLELDDDLDL